jgi:hypothetical protein
MRAMAKDGSDIVVLTDAEGNYYLLSRRLLETLRVPDEHRGVIEDMLESSARSYDFHGRVLSLTSSKLSFTLPEVQMKVTS